MGWTMTVYSTKEYNLDTKSTIPEDKLLHETKNLILYLAKVNNLLPAGTWMRS